MEFYRHCFRAMGTPCEVQLFAPTVVQAKHAALAIVADVQRLERRYSRYRTESLLSQINRVASQGGRITVDAETAGLLNYAQTCYAQSGGLFDISSGALRQAWRFDRQLVPDPEQITRLLAQVGWHRLKWAPPVLEFGTPGMELDFGGIVKEYAVDRAVTLALETGVRHGVVNLGGDLKVIGPRCDGSPWRVGIRHPRQDGVLQTLLLHTGAVASSGDYERCIVLDGVRYGHILNPYTGWPVRQLASVTVLGDFCVVAGSAATIALLREQGGPPWLEQLGLPHLWMDTQGNMGGTLAPH